MKTLPPLPKKYNRAEARITPRVIAWFKKNYTQNSVALEIKVGKNKPLPHQVAALKEVEAGSFAYKLPDQGRRVPFDAVILTNADAYVVLCDGLKCEARNPDGSFAFRC